MGLAANNKLRKEGKEIAGLPTVAEWNEAKKENPNLTPRQWKRQQRI